MGHPTGFGRSLRFARTRKTPFLLLDLAMVGKQFDKLRMALPTITIFYAVKANSEDRVLTLLKKRGSHFDVASCFEIDHLLALGVGPDRMSFGNPIKKESDIRYAYKGGIRNFTTDSLSDVNKIARAAPGSLVMFRLLLEGNGADVTLSRKFGAEASVIEELIVHAARVGLKPLGISFHVGSQQRDVHAWKDAIGLASSVFVASAKKGLKLSVLNLGGGFPAQYVKPTHHVKKYAAAIQGFIKESFGDAVPNLVVEPGRFIVGDAGLLAAEVVLISKKFKKGGVRWVYLDVGKFSGLMETLDEAIKYRILVVKKRGTPSRKTSKVILAGPSCDSTDILYERFQYDLPDNLEEGDRLYFLSAGAYAASMSTVDFNGFPPLKTFIVTNHDNSDTVKSRGKKRISRSRSVIV